MFSRRKIVQGIAVTSLVSPVRTSLAYATSNEEELLTPLESPLISDLTKMHPFGSHPASREEIARADEIIANTPTGPRPIDIAQSFVTRFYASDPHAISQWPKSQSWNPLIARFFEATTLHAKQDTVAWCAAFVNWCLERAKRPATKSSASQSFATTELFSVTDSPVEGDIAVFTCYKEGTNLSYDVGHVTFFKDNVDSNHIAVIGGNQGGKTPSIICEKQYPKEFPSSRIVGGKRVPVEYRLNRFLHVI
ncbi:CHAP domain-containing protein [Nitrobacter sp.]|uniref:CHAP domain-containing protein n=1 Tax=Nitrobacter sp. TaxID=29420 RepID=UPI003F654124